MARIVFIHGIAQEQFTADGLEKDWIPALAGGVRIAGFPKTADRIGNRAANPGDIEARMAFYGNLFLPIGRMGAGVEEMSAEQQIMADQLTLEWLERAEKRASDERQRQQAAIELAHLRPDPVHEKQGPRSIGRIVYNRLARLPWFARLGMKIAQLIVEKALSQVTKYLNDDDIRDKIQQIVHNLITPDTRVIVGHSLGSIVAYEVAHQLKQPLPLLVTIGSPLGLNTIVLGKLRPSPSFPPLVHRWVNVADRDDLVAAEPNLARLFAVSMPRDAIFEGGYTAENGAKPHDALFYLGKEHVGRPVGQVLSTV